MTQKDKNGIAAAGLAGAILGAGVTAAAVALSDKKTREKAVSALHDVKNQAIDMLHKNGTDAQEAINDLKPKAEAITEKTTDDTKKSVMM